MMEAKMMIAGSFDEFVEKITQAERKVLNTPFGQEITERLLKMKLEENPDMTAEEWQDTKSQFLTFLFAMFVKGTPQAMAELSIVNNDGVRIDWLNVNAGSENAAIKKARVIAARGCYKDQIDSIKAVENGIDYTYKPI